MKKTTPTEGIVIGTNNMPKLPNGLTIEQIMDGVERSSVGTDNVGFCIECGKEADGCEPDARKYECEACGKHAVYGAEELLIMFG